jgi:hypothetical protein
MRSASFQIGKRPFQSPSLTALPVSPRRSSDVFGTRVTP